MNVRNMSKKIDSLKEEQVKTISPQHRQAFQYQIDEYQQKRLPVIERDELANQIPTSDSKRRCAL